MKDQTQAEIRRIIEYVTGVYQGTEDYDEDVVIAAIDSYANQRALEAFMLGQGYSFVPTPDVSYAKGYYERTDPDGIDSTVCNEYIAEQKFKEAKRLNLTKEIE